MVRRWRLIGYFLILYYPPLQGTVTFAVSAACMDTLKHELSFTPDSQPLLDELMDDDEELEPKVIMVASNNAINRMLDHEGLGAVRASSPSQHNPSRGVEACWTPPWLGCKKSNNELRVRMVAILRLCAFLPPWHWHMRTEL
jgi:hypothetical protein